MSNETALFYIEKHRIKASVVSRGGSRREFEPARKQRVPPPRRWNVVYGTRDRKKNEESEEGRAGTRKAWARDSWDVGGRVAAV